MYNKKYNSSLNSFKYCEKIYIHYSSLTSLNSSESEIQKKKKKKLPIAINCLRSHPQDHRDAKNRRINRLLGQITNEFAWLVLVLTEVNHRPRTVRNEEKRKRRVVVVDFYEQEGPRAGENSLYRFKYSQAHEGWRTGH